MAENTSELTDTEREIIADLQTVADQLGTTPTVRQYEEYGQFSAGKVQYRFDTWNDAIEAAELQPNQRTVDSETEVLEALRAWVESLDQPPTQALLEQDGPYSISVYIRIAGSFNEALKAAGVEPTRERPIPQESLKADFRRVATDLGKLPSRTEYNEYGSYSPTPFENNWGNWSSVKSTIDVPSITD